MYWNLLEKYSSIIITRAPLGGTSYAHMVTWEGLALRNTGEDFIQGTMYLGF